MAIKTKSRKAKGSRLEKWVKSFFEQFGFPSRRQPGSGIFADFAHDNRIELPGVGELIIECKSWKFGWRTGDKAMGTADMLVIKRDFGSPCFYIPESTMVAICKALKEMEILEQCLDSSQQRASELDSKLAELEQKKNEPARMDS